MNEETITRQEQEAAFHDLVRNRDSADYDKLNTNKKFYAITRSSVAFTEGWLAQMSVGKKVLDYCCGEGMMSLKLAKQGAYAYGIDISPYSIEQAKKEAAAKGLSEKTNFSVMDAEKMAFEDNFFDVVVCHGVLHHLDIKKAFPEIARVLKPTGKVICAEPLAYNPVFQLYRRLTPHLRTEWEAHHILTKQDIFESLKSFNDIELRFFHLAALAAVPFRNTPIFKPVLSALEFVDSLLLKLPFVQWWAWQAIFVLSNPKK
jgi:ubiquinone/menaquinone biosynthesis C-methylase UbiE